MPPSFPERLAAAVEAAAAGRVSPELAWWLIDVAVATATPPDRAQARDVLLRRAAAACLPGGSHTARARWLEREVAAAARGDPADDAVVRAVALARRPLGWRHLMRVLAVS